MHEHFPPSYTHLHQDTVPYVTTFHRIFPFRLLTHFPSEFGGDTLWASGYAAFDKLSPKFRTLIEGLNGVYISAHKYLDRENPNAPADSVERLHPLVRTHP